MTLVHRILKCLSLMILLVGTATAGGEIVYNNTTITNKNVAFYSPFEFGDEIFLAGTARIINEFRFDYHGNFLTPTNSSTTTGRVRFYANDGELQSGAHLPGTKLFDSGEFPVFSGYNSLVLSGLDVKVPDDFTWTVQFGGLLDGNVGNRAGLLLFGPPTVGNSYADFWIKGTQGWTILEFSSGLAANFNGIFFATSENDITLAPPTRHPDGSVQVDTRGPIGVNFALQATTDFLNWTNVATGTFVTRTTTLTDTNATEFPYRFYRSVIIPGR